MGKSLGEMTPQQVKLVADLGLASNFFNIGDTTTIQLGAFTHPITGASIPAQPVTFELWGVNHDDKADGTGKASLTFGMRDLLGQTVRMNLANDNGGGWNGAEMRTQFMAALLNAIPQAWRDIIVPVTKLTANNGNQGGSGTATVIQSTDSVFLFSQAEISTNTSSVVTGEGTIYEIWQGRGDTAAVTNAYRIKNLSNGAGATQFWWVRSPVSSSATFFRAVSTTGSLSSGSASFAGGVCLGFCV